jgi:uncharacterized membrane protein YccC
MDFKIGRSRLTTTSIASQCDSEVKSYGKADLEAGTRIRFEELRLALTNWQQQDTEPDRESAPLLHRSRPASAWKAFIQSDQSFRHSSQVSVGILLACMLSFIVDFQYIREWAAITVLVIFEASYGGFLRKAVQVLTL